LRCCVSVSELHQGHRIKSFVHPPYIERLEACASLSAEFLPGQIKSMKSKDSMSEFDEKDGCFPRKNTIIEQCAMFHRPSPRLTQSQSTPNSKDRRYHDPLPSSQTRARARVVAEPEAIGNNKVLVVVAGSSSHFLAIYTLSNITYSFAESRSFISNNNVPLHAPRRQW
jgi:hypothetical protein